MNKSFLSVSSSEGNGNAQVNIRVKENFSLEKRSESLNIRTANGIEKQVRIFQEPGIFFFPTMVLSGIKPGQGEEEFAPLDHYPVVPPQSDRNWLVDSINIGSLLSKFMNGGGLLLFRLRMIMKRSFFEEFLPDINQGGSTYHLEDKRKELEDLDREWYLKDDWFYAGYDWNMDYPGGYQTLPSATLEYDNGEGEYKTLFEWRFSAGSMDLLPQ
nr:MAG: putative binding domain protein [Bacteriophage sp.]